MTAKTILHINSSGRYKDSITRQVSELVVEHLKESAALQEVIKRDVAEGVPFINEVWINSNFTAQEERTEEQKMALSFSNELVAELKKSDYIVMATPIYNFSIPAVLKAWIDLIARAGLTFRYTENGPVGLLENKKAIVVMASGGVPIGSEMDMASGYLKFVLGFIGIHDVTIIDASVIDYLDDDEKKHRVKSQIAGLIDLEKPDGRRKK
ncbi:FMN-dependent NADH-azoreductase [hydrothermal vent metagenome]|uniref:FMN-dependent NADH-azoreductase n=1 Tax=hydrothermal vent metagenome TaxID=652676 RepID=A0A3B0W145_9ZZZZ